MGNVITLIIGLMLGTINGFFIAALATAASRSDAEIHEDDSHER